LNGVSDARGGGGHGCPSPIRGDLGSRARRVSAGEPQPGTVAGAWPGAWTAFLAAALHPGRVLGIVNIATWAPFLTPPLPWRAVYDFDAVHEAEEAWAKDTRHYWLRDWRGYAEFFFGELLSEPHSTKQHEDGVGWVMESTAEANLLLRDAPLSSSCREETEALRGGASAHPRLGRSELSVLRICLRHLARRPGRPRGDPGRTGLPGR